MPECIICGEKETKNFSKDGRKRDGYSSHCKQCHALNVKLWRMRNGSKAGKHRKTRINCG